MTQFLWDFWPFIIYGVGAFIGFAIGGALDLFEGYDSDVFVMGIIFWPIALPIFLAILLGLGFAKSGVWLGKKLHSLRLPEYRGRGR